MPRRESLSNTANPEKAGHLDPAGMGTGPWGRENAGLPDSQGHNREAEGIGPDTSDIGYEATRGVAVPPAPKR